MKWLFPLLAAAAVAALALARPAGAPAPRAGDGWTVASPSPRSSTRAAEASSLVYVAGAVARPGVYRVAASARVQDAVAQAGGSRGDADPIAVNLAAHLRDGDEIVVPVRGAADALAPRRSRTRGSGRRRRAAEPDLGAPRRGHRSRGSRLTAVPPSAPVDLNTAGSDELASVPGIGPGLALRIVAFRDANGPFASPDELLDVSGITDRRLDAILPYVVAR